MTSTVSNDKARPREPLGFLLIITLIWLCLFTLSQAQGFLSGTAVLIGTIRGDVPVLTGIGFFLLSVVLLALGILSIAFLVKGNRRFYAAFAVCQLSQLLTQLFSSPIDLPAVAAFLIMLLFAGGIWVLLFVSDRPRRRFGLPVLHPNKPRNAK